jgi:hypothetical protein
MPFSREEVSLPLLFSMRKFAALSTISSMVVMHDANGSSLVPLETRVCFRNERHRQCVKHKSLERLKIELIYMTIAG